MRIEKLLPIKNWIANHFAVSKARSFKSESGVLNIPIQPYSDKKQILPVHTASSSYKRPYKLNDGIINALGGLNNIETYHEIPNSRRIRLTLVNPSLIDNDLLEELDVRMFIRIGKRIVHIIP